MVCLGMFSVFISITQFSDFWVMSYGNWKHILGVFKLWKQSYDGIFVNTHTLRDPRLDLLLSQTQLSSSFFSFLSFTLGLTFLYSLHLHLLLLFFLFSFLFTLVSGFDCIFFSFLFFLFSFLFTRFLGLGFFFSFFFLSLSLFFFFFSFLFTLGF